MELQNKNRRKLRLKQLRNKRLNKLLKNDDYFEHKLYNYNFVFFNYYDKFIIISSLIINDNYSSNLLIITNKYNPCPKQSLNKLIFIPLSL